MEVHFIDVGCGNMTLIKMPDGSILCYDCNITDDNRAKVINYVDRVIGSGTKISVFINSHRDADHMRGIQFLNYSHPIQELWDSGVPGTTTNSPEYNAYMNLRRSISCKEIQARNYWTYGEATLRCMNSKWNDYSDANEQSIVIKIEYSGSSVILTGDTNYRPWKEKILTYYSDADLNSSILLASHHGSISFFDDPSESQYYYEAHIKKIQPVMTIISVGPNVHDLPDKNALKIYDKHSSGSSQGNKVFTTQDKGTMKLIFKDDGGWELSVNQ